MLRNIVVHSKVHILLVGGLSLLVAYSSFLLLLLLNAHYQVASVVHFLVYLVLNFILTTTWVFQQNEVRARQALGYIALHSSNQLVIMLGLYILIELVGAGAWFAQLFMQALVSVLVLTITPIIFRSR